MAVGEGLTGTIAKNIETLNLAEAKAHPDFLYRPETGEEKFHSFAGVPIVYRERAVGVLCVQHVDPRRYEEVEIEALQTTAMDPVRTDRPQGTGRRRGSDRPRRSAYRDRV